MATERQIQANRRNAKLAKGPSSPSGKATSSRNSTRHWLAAETLVASELSPTFEGRLAQWSRYVRPETAEAAFALRPSVAMSLRIE